MKRMPVLILLVFLIGCGSSGSGDVTKADESIGPVVESNYRDVMLEWLPNSEANLAGYRVFMRADGQNYDYNNPEWETVETDCKFYNLNKHTTYHFIVRAFDTDGNESGDSNEVTLEEI